MTVEVEVSERVFSDQVGALETLRQRLSQAIERVIGIRAGVRLVEPHTIARSEGKARRVVDQRKD
jgi:phenylacetate-CoA ligase